MQIEGPIDMTQCLIVDRCEAERSRIRGLLEPYDFDLEVADGAGDALEKCRSGMPDMIMMSDRLGDMSAFEFIKKVRRAGRGSGPVLLVYADQAKPSQIGRAIWEGANECLMQPFDADVLDGKLRQVGLV